MTSGSIFPDIKSINPATLSQRRIRMYSVTSSTDKVIKIQERSSFESADSDIAITTLNLFYGGKGGSGTTFEFVIYNSAG